MPQLDSDGFTYSNGSLATVSSSKWTAWSGSFSDDTVTSNQISGPSLGGQGADVIASWSGSATDHYGQFKVISLSAADNSGPTLRMDTSTQFYLLAVTNAANTDLYKFTSGGGYVILNTVAITWAANDVAYVEIQGTTIISKQNGTTKHNFTDSALASGKPGMRMGGTSIIMDDWAAGDFSGGATVTYPMLERHTRGLERGIVTGGWGA